MLTMFLFFIVGAVTHKVLQFILSITPSFKIYKHAEMCALNVLLDVHNDKLKSLEILKLMSSEIDVEEYNKIENKIKANYKELINDSIKNIKANLPYKVSYSTLEEAYEAYISSRGKEDGR